MTATPELERATPAGITHAELEARALPVPTLSATIGGTITNRVTVVSDRRQREPRPRKSGRRPDQGKRGVAHRVLCVSFYVDDLQLLDALALADDVARSEMLRRLVRAEDAARKGKKS